MNPTDMFFVLVICMLFLPDTEWLAQIVLHINIEDQDTLTPDLHKSQHFTKLYSQQFYNEMRSQAFILLDPIHLRTYVEQGDI